MWTNVLVQVGQWIYLRENVINCWITRTWWMVLITIFAVQYFQGLPFQGLIAFVHKVGSVIEIIIIIIIIIITIISNGNRTRWSTIHNGNRTEWSPIRSVIIWVNRDLTQQDGWKTQEGGMTKKCRARLCIPNLTRHFFIVLPSWVFQPSCS